MNRKIYLFLCCLFCCMATKLTAQTIPGDSLVFGPEFSVTYNDSVRVWVMTKNSTGSGDALSVELRDASNTLFVGTPVVSDSRIGYNIRSFAFSGLQSGSTYTASVMKNGTTVVRSATVTNKNSFVSNFEFLAGGCGRIMDMTRCVDQVEGPLHTNGSPDIYKHMANENSDLMVWLGDATYLFGIEHAQGMCSGMVNDWDNMDALVSRYTFNRQFHDTLLRAMPQLAITDNHDMGGNEYNKTMATIGLTKQNFMNWWQNPQYMSNAAGQGLYSSYKYKDVEFFLLDNRSYRESTTSHLGPDQLAWLKTALLNSTAPFKVLISGTPAFNKAWGGRNFSITAQCDTLLKFIKVNNINGVMCYSADIHQQQFYGKYNDHTYPFFDILSGNLASDIGTSGSSVNPNSDDIFNSNAQTYVRTNLYGAVGDRRYKIEYVSPEGIVYYGTIIHEDMLKSVDDSTKKLSLSFNGTLTDSSKYNRIVTGLGIGYNADNAGTANAAAHFDGTNVITVPYADELNFKDRTFSIAFWLKPATNPGAEYSSVFSNSNGTAGFTLAVNAAGQPLFINHANGNSYTATLRVKLDEWSHLVWKYDNVKLQLSLYYKGQLVQKWTNVPTPNVSTADLMIGNNAAGKHFKGDIDQLNIYGKLITDSTIQQLSNYHSHRGGVVVLPGTQNVVIPTAQLNASLANNFTIEFWARTTADPATGAKLMACNGRVNNLTRGFALEFSDANKVNIAFGTNGSGWNSVTNSGNPFQTNEWNHVALVGRKNDSLFLYINGLKVAGVAFTQYFDNTFGLSLANSTQYSGTAAPMEMDELRIWSTAQSLDSIKSRMYRTLSGTESNLAFYYNFDTTVSNAVPSIGSNTTAITLTGASTAGSTAPVAVVDTAFRKSIAGNWTIRKEANTGLTLVDNITLQISNLIAAHNADTTVGILSAADSTYYFKGGWQLDANNLPIGTLKVNLATAMPNAAAITAVASEYYLLKQDGTTLTEVNSGYYDGANLIFMNTFIDTGKYFIGWKQDAAAAIFDRGGALSMLGSHNIQLPYAAVNSALSGPFTVEFWARLMKDNTDNVKLLSDNGRVNNNTTGLSIELAANGGTINAVFGTNTNNWTTINSGTPWQVGEWNHIAVTALPGGAAKFYVNGKFIDSAAYSGFVANTTNLSLGTSLNYGLESIGMMDEFRIWNKVKTAAEIQNQMHLSVDSDANLLYNYTFNQLNGTYLKNFGTLHDSTTYTNAVVIPASSPVGNIQADKRYHVTGSWSIRDSANSGLSVLVAIPDFETNYILGRDSLSGTDSLLSVPNGVRLKKFWQIDPLRLANGNFNFNGVELFGVNWNDVKNSAIEFYLLKKDSTGTMSIGAVGVLNNDDVAFDNINLANGLYSLGWKTNAGVQLPLLWGSINGVFVDDHHNLIQWQTIQEHQVASFEIERSFDGKSFEYIGSVKANGESNKPSDYTFNDNHAEVTYSGIYFYRVKEVDLDGNSNYSPVVKIMSERNADAFDVLVSPNPGASSQMKIAVNQSDAVEYTLTLMSVSGDIIWYKNAQLDKNGKSLLPNVTAGTYFLKVMSGNKVATKKIVVR